MPDGLCPFAKHELMHYNDSLPMREHKNVIIFHTNGGGTGAHGDLHDYFNRAGNDICSHFQVALDGTIYQYVNIRREAYAQYSGNAYGVSVETEDDGHPDKKWTAAQVKSLVQLADWIGAPARVAADGGSPGGVGWHSLYQDWNRDGHQCPGNVRVGQIHTEIIPAMKNGDYKHKSHPHPTHAPKWYHRILELKSPMMHGEDVKHLQVSLGMNPKDCDGVFGHATKNEVEKWQQKHHLRADGVFGPASAKEAFKAIH